ncbi:hypothetical protein LTR27_009447 [Elasticomyces elasticus]|nr:hypothetical protein LTR27_009447 [Elasticomyces elasticus]
MVSDALIVNLLGKKDITPEAIKTFYEDRAASLREAEGGELTHEVPSVVEHARGYAFSGEIDSSTNPSGMASEFQEMLAMLLNAFHRQSHRREM